MNRVYLHQMYFHSVYYTLKFHIHRLLRIYTCLVMFFLYVLMWYRYSLGITADNGVQWHSKLQVMIPYLSVIQTVHPPLNLLQVPP